MSFGNTKWRIDDHEDDLNPNWQGGPVENANDDGLDKQICVWCDCEVKNFRACETTTRWL